jgi:beta-galactosidase
LGQLHQSFAARSVELVTDSPPLVPSGHLVRLYFTELEDKQPGERVFDVRVEGRTVIEKLDIAAAAGGPRRALSKTFRVNAGADLEIEFVPKTGLPLISGLEVIRED